MPKYYLNYLMKSQNEYDYKINQYEDLGSNGRFYFKENVDARYIDHPLPEYNENMLVKALPPIYSTVQILKALEKKPEFKLEEIALDPHIREHAIYRLSTDCLFVLRSYVDLYKQLTITINRSLINKRVMTKEFTRIIRYNSEVLNGKKKGKLQHMKSISSNIQSGAAGFSIIGISGGGKTTALNNVLSLLPQCIVHKSPQHYYLFRQITYIKIDCSYDGSLKGICHNFLKEVDSILDSNYTEKHFKTRTSVDDLIAIVAHITQLHAIGALIIDEIQHLSNSVVNAEKVLNFFVTLQNKLKVPIIYCGTYKAIRKVLSQDYRQARRATGIGEIHWRNMKNDKEYKIFMQKLWKYQWLKKPIELSDEIMDFFYEKTCGITDRIIKLFMATQLEAIITRKEMITVKLIKKVDNNQMALTKPMIDALQSGVIKNIEKYDDLYSIDFSNIQQKQHSLISNLEKSKIDVEFDELQRQAQIKFEIVNYLRELDIEAKQAEMIAEKVLDENGYDVKLSKLKNKSISLLYKSNDSISFQNSNDIETNIGYDNLKNNGLIKDDII